MGELIKPKMKYSLNTNKFTWYSLDFDLLFNNLTQKFNKLNFLKNGYEENLLKINLDNDKINFDLSVEDFFVSENLFFGLDSNLIDFLSNESEVISYYNNILGLFEVYDFLEGSNEMFQNFLDIDESFLNNKKVVLNVEEKNYVDILDLKKSKTNFNLVKTTWNNISKGILFLIKSLNNNIN